MTAQLSWSAPASVMVGQATPILPVDATATMGALITQALGVVGAATVEGTADTTGIVVAPGGDIGVPVPLTVPRMNVPASGAISLRASGRTPVLSFRRAGRATITIGTGFAVHLIARDANGDPTPFGQIEASCTLEPGQNTVLSSFEIIAPATAPAQPGAAPAKTSGPARGGTAGPTGGGSATTDPAGTVAAGPGEPVPSPGASDPGTEPATATQDQVVATASTARSVGMHPLLVGGGIMVAGAAVLGGLWWLKRGRRHRRSPETR